MVKSADEERTKANSDGEREGPAGTLARGLAILDAIVDAPQPLLLGEIATLTRLDQSTTLRLLRTLEDSGYVVRLADSKRYAPSPKALLPLPLMHPINQLRRESHSILIELARTLRETVVLVLYLSTERMVTDIAQAPGSLSPYYNTWLHGPLHGSGSGKALLLSLDAEQRAAILGPEPYKAFTAQTITKQADLERDLATSAERGYVVAHDEHHLGLTAIAANIPTWNNGHVGCLVVTGHSRDMDEARVADIGLELVRVAKLMPYQLSSLRSVAHVVGK
ncbi:IclR family transcriptional regulator [Azospirillum brasilense]|uniref:IclR family transcriptional regulator n=1 Tax=Azospirillum brasilense TaxID=192 RepID=UPI001EDC0AB2|nr:IclR family transcriptional regulator [Azospirillum brasilense]UKJ76551.1 IclR family transcriptional regulator [Azospirillum brasilense]